MSSTINTSGSASDLVLTDLVGDWFLYTASIFVELTITLVSAMFVYNTVRTLWATSKFTRPTDPINIHKWMILTISLTIFMRACMDAVMLTVWDEVTVGDLLNLVTADRILTVLAFIPFSAFSYLLFRAGPSIEFQLLRQPIPTDMHATWVMLKKPAMGVGLIMVLSLLVALAKI